MSRHSSQSLPSMSSSSQSLPSMSTSSQSLPSMSTSSIAILLLSANADSSKMSFSSLPVCDISNFPGIVNSGTSSKSSVKKNIVI